MLETLRKNARIFRERSKGWFEANGMKLFLFIGILLSGALAFGGGFLLGRDRQVDPMIVSVPASPCVQTVQDIGTPEAKPEGAEGVVDVAQTKAAVPDSSVEGNVAEHSSCVFVGSRNSDKYHLPTCSWAKRIKPENRVCFTSAADAESKGYHAGCVK